MEDDNKNIKNSISTQIVVYVIFFAVSVVISLIYICHYVDFADISKILLSGCILYFSLFIFLQFVTNLDLLVHKHTYTDLNAIEFSQDFMKYFYFIFNILNCVLKYLFLPFFIGYSKSGYVFSRCRRFIDAIFYHYILVTMGLTVVAFGAAAFLSFKTKILKFYNNYGSFILNCLNFLGLIQVYVNVGFFIVEIIVDMRRKANKDLIRRYSNFLITKLSKKVVKDVKKMQNAIDKLTLGTFVSVLKNTEVQYLFNQAKNNQNLYGVNFNQDKESNVKGNKNEIGEYTIQLNEDESLHFRSNLSKIEKEMAPYIRTFKKQLRNIKRLKYLIEEGEKKEKRDLNKSCCYIIFLFIKYIFYIGVFLVIIFTDFIMPLIKAAELEGNRKSQRNLEEKMFNYSVSEWVIFILKLLINTSYTFAVLFSLNKRLFISGNLLYGKNHSDNLNLIYSIQTIAGMAFPLSYCNLYLWYNVTFDMGKKGQPTLYDVIKFPEYLILGKVSYLIFLKFGLMLSFGLFSLCCEKCFKYRINDVGKYNKDIMSAYSTYDNLKGEILE